MSSSRQLRPFAVVPSLTRLEDRAVPAGFTADSIQDQNGWGGGTVAIDSRVDQVVDQGGNLAYTGDGAFRLSNSTVNGDYMTEVEFAGWPFSPGLTVAAGEPASGAAADMFTATFWFRTVSSTADGSAMEFNLGVASGDDRNSYIALWNRADADGGLQLVLAEPIGNSGDFYEYVVEVEQITRGVWHRLDVTAKFIDGSANDTFTIALNGEVVANSATPGVDTFATFEGYFEGSGQGYKQTSRLLFRSELLPSDLGAFVDDAAQGFAVDNLSYSSASSSNPTSPLAYYFTGFEADPSLVYVDDAFAGLADGTAVADADPTTAGNQPAVVGQSAFANLADGLAAVAAGGQVWAFGGTYTGASSVFDGNTLVVGGAGGTAVVSTGAVAFAAGATLAVDLNGSTAGSGYDRLESTGAVDIGAAELVVNAGYTPAPGDVFTIVTAAGGVAGRFAGLPEGATLTIGGLQYRIRYTTNSVVLALDQSDLAVTVTDGKGATAANAANTYTITVTNAGPSAVSGAVLAVALPAGLSGVTYTSVAAGGATGNTNGVGAPGDTLTLPSGASVTYTLTGTVSPAAAGTHLVVVATITPPAASVYDPTPGNNRAADATAVFIPDTTPPVLTINPNGPLVAGQPQTVIVTFSEPVTGFTAGDLFVTNGTVSGFNGAGAVYTFALTPTATGLVQVAVQSGTAVDAAGNPNQAATGIFGVGAPPVVVVPPVTPSPATPVQPRVAASVGGVVRVTNLADGFVREVVPFPGFTGDISTALGDLNGDGFPELVVGAGAGAAPHVKAYDGATGAEVLSFFAYSPAVTTGVFVAADAGRIAVGTGAGAAPHVRVLDAAGNEQQSFFAYNPNVTSGVRVALTDLDGNGTPDLVTGAGPGAAPHVRGFTLPDLIQVASFFAADPGDLRGVFVA